MAALTSIDVPILLYHHLIPDDQPNLGAYEICIRQFEAQLDLIRQLGFSTIHFAALFDALENGKPTPARSIVISFDDGFCSFLELGLPALLKRGMTSTIFVPAGEIGGVNRWDLERGFPERRIMNEQELQQVAAEGIEVGSHGWAHRQLPKCNETEAREEVARSREWLKALGLASDFFAYPYGEYAARCFPLLEEAGYRGATSIFSDTPSVTANRFAMRRVYIHADDTPQRFRLKLSRLYLRYKAWRGLQSAS